MTDLAVARPLGELDLGNQSRLHPVYAARARRSGDRRRRTLDSTELLAQSRQRLGVEAGAYLAGVAQYALVVVGAEQQRAQPDARARRLAPADDDELLAARALDLEPGAGASRFVAGVAALRDHALHTALACALEERRAVTADVVAVAQRRRARRVAEELRQQALALEQRRTAQVVAVEVQQIEEEEMKTATVLAQRFLQRLEARSPALVEHDRLTVEERGVERQLRERLRERRKRSVQSSPPRVISRTLPRSIRPSRR